MNKHDLRPLLSILARFKPGKLADKDVAAVLPELTNVWDSIPGATDARIATQRSIPPAGVGPGRLNAASRRDEVSGARTW
jgi:hypothetical protein